LIVKIAVGMEIKALELIFPIADDKDRCVFWDGEEVSNRLSINSK
jgi:hypothetical protein